MLVISRKAGEAIRIGEDIEITIVDISPSRVKIGLVAPRGLPIRRGELWQAASENVAASEPDRDGLNRLIQQFSFSSYTKAIRR